MSIAIIGGNGGMGRRYQSILSHLDKDFHVADIEHTEDQIIELVKRSEGVIIATPTETHAGLVAALSPLRKPILCEKPISKNMDELKACLLQVKTDQTPFSMVYQYKSLANPYRLGWSHYNYFRHGNDGLAWDCIQIIGLARQQLELEETSPIWRCSINGEALDLSSMDYAYIAFIRDWLKLPNQDLGQLLATHEKTAAMDKELRHVS